MDILVVCPTYNRLFSPTIRAMFNMTAVDGGRLDLYFPWQGYGDGERDGRDVIADKYNDGRMHALNGGYDAMLCIESDMIVPLDTPAKLAACDADVAYGLYVFRRQPWQWSAYSVMLSEKKMTGFPLSNVPPRARMDWGSVVDVDGVGLGCTLIRRKVLERLAFRSEGGLHANGLRSHCDWYFALDCVRRRYTQRCDLSVLCGHISTHGRDNEPFPCVIWPDIEAEGFVRFDAFGYDEDGIPEELESAA